MGEMGDSSNAVIGSKKNKPDAIARSLARFFAAREFDTHENCINIIILI